MLAICALASVPFIAALCVIYVANEHPAYVWDYGAYWGYFKDYAKLISSGAPGWTSRLWQDIDTLDYNPVAAVLLYPAYLIGGDGRTTYIIAVCLLYLLPAVIIATLVAKQAAPRLSVSVIFLMALTYIPFWKPSLRGMVDVVGLIPIGLTTLLLLRTDFLTKRKLTYGLTLGVLIYLPFLLRRWYAYSIVATMALALVFGATQRIYRGVSWPRAVMSIVWPMAISGALATALLLTFQMGLVKRILTSTYADLTPYQADFSTHMTLFSGELGWYFIAAMLFGFAVSVATRNIAAIFCTLAAAVTFLLFIQTQQLAPHHFLPIAFWLFVPYVVAVNWVAERLPRTGYLSMVAAGVCVFVLSTVPGLKQGGPYIAPLVPRYASFPLHLDNYTEYKRLLSDLRSTLTEKQTVVVYSTGQAISDAMLTALDADMTQHINYVSYTPMTVLFRLENLRADYALVRTDRQHQFPDALKNIWIPNDMILSGTGIGAAYERLDTYQMSEGQSVALFRRTRPVTKAEAGALLAALRAAYGKVLAPSNTMEFGFALRQDEVGDTFGVVQPTSPTTLFMHPGKTQPTSTSIPVDAAIDGKMVALNLSIPSEILKACPLADGVDATVSINGAVTWRGIVSPGKTERIGVTTSVETISIMIDKRSAPDCDHVTATFDFNGTPPTMSPFSWLWR